MRIFKFVIITLFLFTLFYSNASCEKHKDENSDDLGNLDESLTEETKKYSIMVSESENGKVETDKAEVSAGQFVIFTILPNVGYECECLIINDKEVEIAENKYILFDVREDINVSAIFKLSKIKISYFDDTGTILLYQITSETLPCEAPFKNGVPSKKIDDKYYYVFEGWYTEKVGGEKVEDFIFTKSTKLYAHFTKEEYSVSLEKDIEMNLFESKKIDISTTLDIPYTVKYKSSNKNILEVSQDGIIKAIADGNAEVIVEIAGVEHVCTVKVVCDEVLFKAQYVYGNGYVKYEGNTGIIYTSQATIVDQQNIPVLHKYVDYSLDMYFESETTGNFGLVVNKKIDSNGAASSSIQFNFETGKTNNVKLIVDSKTIADTIKTYSFEIGKAYNFRIVTAPDAIGKVRVICYINGESIIDVVTDEPSGEGMQCGIRMAAAVTNRFSNIKVLENIIEYDVDVNETINGKVFVDKTKVIRDGALQLSVQANEGYYLETLIVNVNDITALLSDNTYTINNVLEDINISATFKKYHSIEIADCENGSITSDSVLIKDGQNVTLNITSETGYKLSELIINSESVVILSQSKYVIENVTTDLNIVAVFTEITDETITVEFYVNSELVQLSQVLIGESVVAPTINTIEDRMHIYLFESWQDAYGNICDDFTFETDMKLYAHFNDTTHYLGLNYDRYELNALESIQLVANTTATFDFQYLWSSENENIATVDENGNVFAVGTGTTKIFVTIDDVMTSCQLTVKAAEGYMFKGVYGQISSSTWDNGVYTFGKGGVQADLVDLNGNLAQMDYFEIELNLILGCDVGTGANFGFQINKTKNDNGSVKESYMLKPMTTANSQFLENSNKISSVENKSIKLQANKLYRIKIVVEKVDSGINIKAYINNEVYFDYIDTTPLSGTIFGIRCAALSDNNSPHKVSIVSVTKK